MLERQNKYPNEKPNDIVFETDRVIPTTEDEWIILYKKNKANVFKQVRELAMDYFQTYKNKIMSEELNTKRLNIWNTFRDTLPQRYSVDEWRKVKSNLPSVCDSPIRRGTKFVVVSKHKNNSREGITINFLKE